MFEQYTEEAGKKQFLIPYFIAAHPGTTDEDMLQLAIWLKKNGFRADQVQAFYPSPMASATAMYHSWPQPAHARTPADARRGRGGGGRRARRAPPAPAQGLPALPRPEQLAAAARGPERHGPRRPDRQRQAPPDPHLPAADRRQLTSRRGARTAARPARARAPVRGATRSRAGWARAARRAASLRARRQSRTRRPHRRPLARRRSPSRSAASC